jgi:transposase-like protein
MENVAETLRDAILYFSDFENCRKFMIELRWSDGVVRCPQCGADKVTWLAKARVWKCYAKHERPTFTLKTGSIFEASPIPVEKWLVAAWLLISCKNGVSSYEVHRALGVTQKSAWFMLHRIRLAMQESGFAKLSGEIEVDESYIGGKSRNMHKNRKLGRGPGNKDIVFGMLERDGNVRAIHTHGRGKPELQRHIREHVEAGSAIFSDELHSYDGLSTEFKHDVINHAIEYAHGNVHTNGMENFWSLLKRGLRGTYVSVEPFHLFRYLDEQVLRFNLRKLTDAERFAVVMKQIVGRRLTYAALTGKTESGARTRP